MIENVRMCVHKIYVQNYAHYKSIVKKSVLTCSIQLMWLLIKYSHDQHSHDKLSHNNIMDINAKLQLYYGLIPILTLTVFLIRTLEQIHSICYCFVVDYEHNLNSHFTIKTTNTHTTSVQPTFQQSNGKSKHQIKKTRKKEKKKKRAKQKHKNKALYHKTTDSMQHQRRKRFKTKFTFSIHSTSKTKF